MYLLYAGGGSAACGALPHFAGRGNFLYAAYSLFGSVLPDRLEGKPPKESKAYWKWRSKHRQNTHWTVPYLAIIAILFYLHEDMRLRNIPKQS